MVAIVTLAMIASSAAATAPEGLRMPAVPTESRGHPFLEANPQSWMPVLIQTGSTAQAVAAAKATLGQSLSLYPLGDANDDGAGDYLLERRDRPSEEQPGAVLLEAHSGANAKEILWSLDVPLDAYWYPVGDMDGDGVEDLVLDSGEDGEGDGVGESTPVGSFYRYTHTYAGVYEVITGATGKTAFKKTSQMGFEAMWGNAHASAPGAFSSVYVFEFSHEFAGLSPTGVESSMGLDYVSFQGKWRDVSAHAYAAVAFAWGGLDRSTDTLTIERLSPKGETVWKQTWDDESEYVGLGDAADYNGDGAPDLLLYAVGAPTYVGGGAVVTGVYESVPPASKARAFLVDGKSGTTLWETESDYMQGDAMVLPAGALRPGSRDAFLVTIGSEASGAFQGYGSRITAIDGKTGSVLRSDRWEDEFVVAIQFADLDEDKKDELIMVRGPLYNSGFDAESESSSEESEYEFLVVRSDYSPVWSFSPEESEMIFFAEEYPSLSPDYDGDGVPDFLAVNFEGEEEMEIRFEAVSGKDGKRFWSYTTNHTIENFGFVGDVTGDGGVDFAITWFDRPAPNDDGPTPSPGPDGPPSTVAVSPSSRPDEPEDNLTDYPAYVEVHRGSDFALVWKRQVHERSPDLSANSVWTTTAGVADTNRNGFGDVLFTFEAPVCYFIMYMDGDGETSTSWGCDDGRDRDEDEEPPTPVSFALVLDGADGAVLAQFPDHLPSLPSAVSATLGEGAPIPAAPLAADDIGGFLPGWSALVAMLAVLVVVTMRRRA